MSTPRLLPYGDRAVLVEVADTTAVVEYVDLLTAAGLAPEGTVATDERLVADLVPAARTVLVQAAEGVSIERLRTALDRLGQDRRSSDSSGDDRETTGETSLEPIEIAVVYDGPDLAEVAQITGLSQTEVVAAHTGSPWRVAFGGFAPGFGYLVGGDRRLEVPRRDTSREKVPAGAVALAGEFSAVYPRESPGGWQLIGHTDEVLWDLDRDPPALLAQGRAVRFVDAGAW